MREVHPFNLERAKGMAKLRAQGLTLSEIGSRYKMTKQAVSQNLMRLRDHGSLG
jgi:DNA-binding transcriptional ArsR family regulator